MPALTERDERATGAVAPTLAAGVIFAAPDGSVLLLCRSEREANYAGHWALPGGKSEPGETAWMTACRETDEEIGSLTRHAWVGEPTVVDEAVTPTGMAFTTFVQPVRYRFVPELNAEHAGFVWAVPGAFPAPMHPAVARVLGALYPEGLEAVEAVEIDAADDSLALDRATVRSKDADGHLRVERTPITRAVVSPYYGREIPNSAALGLDPERVYQVYRDAAELLAAADTFIGKPVLSEHKASSAENHPRHLTVGAIGGPIDMQGDTLYAPLTIWDKDAIDEIESEEKRNLSCSYRYRYDPTPGKAPDGTPFDGSMKEIIGNHIALVLEPRVPGSMVADNLPAGLAATIPNSGLPAGGFKRAAAPDRKEPDMADKTAKDRAKDESDILAGIKEKLSDDECKALDDMLMAGKANDADKDDEPDAKKADDDADMADKDKKADDADEDEDDKVTKEAMDSALRLAMDAERKHQSDAREAERFVRPWIGEINLAMDASAADIYKTAIEGMGRKVDGVHPSAYRTILEMIPKPGQRQPTTRVAMDSASMSGFAARHPDAARIKLNVVR